jgi:hypothetical protein
MNKYSNCLCVTLRSLYLCADHIFNTEAQSTQSITEIVVLKFVNQKNHGSTQNRTLAAINENADRQ